MFMFDGANVTRTMRYCCRFKSLPSILSVSSVKLAVYNVIDRTNRYIFLQVSRASSAPPNSLVHINETGPCDWSACWSKCRVATRDSGTNSRTRLSDDGMLHFMYIYSEVIFQVVFATSLEKTLSFNRCWAWSVFHRTYYKASTDALHERRTTGLHHLFMY